MVGVRRKTGEEDNKAEREVPRSTSRVCGMLTSWTTLFDDLEELHIEYQHSLWTSWAVAISQLAWNPETGLFAFNHKLDAFSPSFDYRVERELS